MFGLRNIFSRQAIRRLSYAAMKINYYEVLGVKSTATQEEIKTAYYELSKKYHPDITKGEMDILDAKQQFIQVTEAYEILGNTSLRQKYDSGSLDVRDIASRKEHPSTPVSEFEDYSRGLRKKQAVGGSSSSNFDHWTKTHYSKMVGHSAVTKDRLHREKAREKTITFQNKLEVFVVAVFLIGVLMVGMHAGTKTSRHPPQK